MNLLRGLHEYGKDNWHFYLPDVNARLLGFNTYELPDEIINPYHQKIFLDSVKYPYHLKLKYLQIARLRANSDFYFVRAGNETWTRN